MSNNYKPQGSVAVKNGNDLESMIELVLLNKGYVRLTDYERKNLEWHSRAIPFNAFGDRWFSSQVVIGESIYRTPMRIDFVLYDKDMFPKGLIIEAKWQSSNGSVDEKLAYTALSLAKQRGEKILILDGGGFREGAKEYVEGIKSVTTFSLSEFMIFSMRNM